MGVSDVRIALSSGESHPRIAEEMKLFTFRILPVVLLFATLSCVKEPNFSNVPTISAQPFEHYTLTTADKLGNKIPRDSVVFKVGFQDGDGDLGITNDEFDGKGDVKLKGVYNYVVRVFRKIGPTQFTEVFPQLPLTSFFPPLKADGRSGPIEGTLRYSINFIDPSRTAKDTLRFEIKILDRALNVSNAIVTDTLVVIPPVYK